MCISPIAENREIPVFVEALPARETLRQFFSNNKGKDILPVADALVVFLQMYAEELSENEVMKHMNPFLMHKSRSGLTVFEHLYSIGHPVITVLKNKLGEQLWEKIIFQNSGKYPLIVQAINHLFQTAALEYPNKTDINKHYKRLVHLSLVDDKLKKLFSVQTALITGKHATAKKMLQKMEQEHFNLLTRLPALQKLCFQTIFNSFSEVVQKNKYNIVQYPVFFSNDQVQKIAAKMFFSPICFLKDPNFNIFFSILTPLYFWNFAKSKNPIVHQVLGMVFDQLSYMQKQMYLKALSPTMFPFFIKSLRPENFIKVLEILPDDQSEFFNTQWCSVRFLLNEDEMSVLSRAVHNKEQAVAIAFALWVNPGIIELQRWVQALDKVHNNKKDMVASFKMKLEKKLNFFQVMKERSGNASVDIRNLDIDYCQISGGLPESPILLSGKIFDKSSLMEHRPLVDPVTGNKFSFFDLTYQGTVKWRNNCLRNRIFGELRRLNQKVKLLQSQRIGDIRSIKE